MHQGWNNPDSRSEGQELLGLLWEVPGWDKSPKMSKGNSNLMLGKEISTERGETADECLDMSLLSEILQTHLDKAMSNLLWWDLLRGGSGHTGTIQPALCCE